MALIVTIIVIFIISAIGVSSGIETSNSIKISKFYDELKLVQARVDVMYEQLKNEEKTEAEFGGAVYLSTSSIFDTLNIEEEQRANYKFYTSSDLEEYLGLEDISQNILINWTTRDVISADGITVDNVTYYRDTSLYKPTNTEETPKSIAITPTTQTNGDIRKVTITVQDSDEKEITDFTLKYRLKDKTVWRIADNNYFETAILGEYEIEVSGDDLVTTTAEVTLE